MHNIFGKWLKTNKEDNLKALEKLKKTGVNFKQSRHQDTSETLQQSASGLNEDPVASTSKASSDQHILQKNDVVNKSAKKVSDLVFENNDLRMFVVSAPHRQEKKFMLSDHMFLVKIEQTNTSSQAPLLSDILNFLDIAFKHILNHLKRFYKPEDHNVAFLSLFQAPMLNSLNSGYNFIIISS